MTAFGSLDYRPRPPVKAEDFADPVIPAQWIAEKGLAVFSLWSPRFPATEVDVFVTEPLPFDDLWPGPRRCRWESSASPWPASRI
jgi:hypothetical protein